MAKVQAITKVLTDNGGVASLEMIYSNMDKYYPKIKKTRDWQAGIRQIHICRIR
ncbi:MAG: hypothetical protein J5985_01365 [Kiritimatiellae bacterium]|nr:hypothetical protein [Kiritimatiellia bacterium]